MTVSRRRARVERPAEEIGGGGRSDEPVTDRRLRLGLISAIGLAQIALFCRFQFEPVFTKRSYEDGYWESLNPGIEFYALVAVPLYMWAVGWLGLTLRWWSWAFTAASAGATVLLFYKVFNEDTGFLSESTIGILLQTFAFGALALLFVIFRDTFLGGRPVTRWKLAMTAVLVSTGFLISMTFGIMYASH